MPEVSRPFPTQDDLDFARKQDEFRYTGEVAPNTYQMPYKDAIALGKKVLAKYPNATADDIAGNVRNMGEQGQLQPLTDQRLVDTMALNRLAAHRSALASLGMGSSLDTTVAGTNWAFDENAGKTIAQRKHPLFSFIGNRPNKQVQSTPVHEAAHRGLFRVLDELEGMPNSPETSELRDMIADPAEQGGNEQLIRLMMRDTYGDPESDTQPQWVKSFLNDPANAAQRDKIARAGQLAETIAAKLVQRRKPGGPF